MTREETKKIIMGIQCSYPNFKPQVPLDFLVEIWMDDLSDYTYEQVYTALKVFKATDKSGFAPSVGQLIDKMFVTQEKEVTEMEAWNMVRRAICNSGYNSQAEFEKLPGNVQAIVGSPAQLHQWSQTDISELETVIQSNFMRSYKAKVEHEKKYNRLPASVKMQIEARDSVAMIESNKEA